MDSESFFIQEKLELWLTFNLGLALIGSRTTGPRMSFWGMILKENKERHAWAKQQTDDNIRNESSMQQNDVLSIFAFNLI